MDSKFLKIKTLCTFFDCFFEAYKIIYSLFWIFGIYTFLLSKIIEVSLITFDILNVNTVDSFLTKHFLLNIIFCNIPNNNLEFKITLVF